MNSFMNETKFNQWQEIEKRLENNSVFRGLVYPNIRGMLNALYQCWFEEHRYYHDIGHLYDIFQQINMTDFVFDGYPEIMEVVAAFHDAVYQTGAGTRAGATNEEDSVAFFRQFAINNNFVEEKKDIEQAILDSKDGKGRCMVSTAFQKLDRAYLNTEKPLYRVIEIETGIFKEYQFLDFSIYREKRLEFLESQQNEENYEYLEPHIDFLSHWRPRIGVYAGSFDPFTHGHKNIFHKAEQLFDKVLIFIGVNSTKQSSALSGRKLNIQRIFPYHQIVVYPGFLTDFIKQQTIAADTTLVRGLRTGFDFSYEQIQLRYMEDMYQGLKVVYIPCDRQFEYISSSGVKAIRNIDMEAAKKYLP